MNLRESLQSTFRGKKVLVSGHTGFKGTWLCEWLVLLGAEVSGFSLRELPTSPSLFEQVGLADRMEDLRGNVRNSEEVGEWISSRNPDFLFHLAAQPLVRFSYELPVDTWETNVMGTIHVLEGLRRLSGPCSAVMVTTDKVYENREWDYAYRESDPLGGHDPYSSSKAGAEIAIASWRRSFFADHSVSIASARAGNVVGGGDWAANRIVPDAMRALGRGEPIPVRNPGSTRPWQHVLEPLSGYLTLAARLAEKNSNLGELETAFNFGPRLDSNRPVRDLVEEVFKHWDGTWEDFSNPDAPHEAGKLNLATDRALHLLGWEPRWDFRETIKRTVVWYRGLHDCRSAKELMDMDLSAYPEDL